MKRKKLAFGIVVYIGFLFLAACSNPQKDIIGSWKTSNGETIEFSADKTVKGTENNGFDFSGKYKFIGDENVEISTNGILDGQYQIKISGDELDLKSVFTKFEMKYQRVK